MPGPGLGAEIMLRFRDVPAVSCGETGAGDAVVVAVKTPELPSSSGLVDATPTAATTGDGVCVAAGGSAVDEAAVSLFPYQTMRNTPLAMSVTTPAQAYSCCTIVGTS